MFRDVGIGEKGLPRLRLARAAILLLCLGLGACAATDAATGPTAGVIEAPKYRVGVLPFPGMFSALAIPEPDQLGEHRYEGLDSPFSPEQGRGLLYSCDAGFLDVAHIRKSADWARYLALEIRAALNSGSASVVIQAEEPSRYHLAFRYPPDWQRLAPGERDALIEELSIRLGEQVSEVANTWHEIVTFYGYNSTPLLSEKRSAFTYDDMTSHLVGARVAATAMRDNARGYDEAVTVALRAELDRLRVVSAAQTKIALQAVKGQWWDSFSARKRDLRAALDDRHTVPWIVRGLAFCPDPKPAPLTLPGLADVHGRDFTGFLDLAIEPNLPQAKVFLAPFDPKPDLVRPAEHFPAIMAGIRAALVADYGDDVDRPYP